MSLLYNLDIFWQNHCVNEGTHVKLVQILTILPILYLDENIPNFFHRVVFN